MGAYAARILPKCMNFARVAGVRQMLEMSGRRGETRHIGSSSPYIIRMRRHLSVAFGYAGW